MKMTRLISALLISAFTLSAPLSFAADASKGPVSVSKKAKAANQDSLKAAKKDTTKKVEAKKAEDKKSSEPTAPEGKKILTGPKGGKYYINDNGKKVYVK